MSCCTRLLIIDQIIHHKEFTNKERIKETHYTKSVLRINKLLVRSIKTVSDR